MSELIDLGGWRVSGICNNHGSFHAIAPAVMPGHCLLVFALMGYVRAVCHCSSLIIRRSWYVDHAHVFVVVLGAGRQTACTLQSACCLACATQTLWHHAAGRSQCAVPATNASLPIACCRVLCNFSNWLSAPRIHNRSHVLSQRLGASLR